MSKPKKFFLYWLPLLVWMSVIFGASCDTNSVKHSSTLFEPLVHWLFPRMSATHVEELHHLFRKSCHMMEYAIMAVLAWRAIRQPQRHDPRPWGWDEAGLALSIVFCYAATDEFHQLFVPGRTGQVSDVAVDVIGGAIGLAIVWVAGKKFKCW